MTLPALPRFVSLRTEGANGRHGPGLEHRVDWIYERAGLPLLVTAESGPWRRVRDPDGGEVWMHARNLDNAAHGLRARGRSARCAATRNPAHASLAIWPPGVVGALTGCEAIGGAFPSAAASAGWRRTRSGAARTAPGFSSFQVRLAREFSGHCHASAHFPLKPLGGTAMHAHLILVLAVARAWRLRDHALNSLQPASAQPRTPRR